jgi:hypothetical protein
MAQVFQRDDGLYQIGLTDDAPGPFESRMFAEAVASMTTSHEPRALGPHIEQRPQRQTGGRWNT